MQESEKERLIKKHSPHSPIVKNSILAFIFGGSICVIGELLLYLFLHLGLDEKTSLTLVTLSLIFIAALLTSIGIFDKIVSWANCGLIVPITGFAHAMTSAAMEYKKEGLILGIGANIFKLAGTVILYGIVSVYIFGLIRLLVMGG